MYVTSLTETIMLPHPAFHVPTFSVMQAQVLTNANGTPATISNTVPFDLVSFYIANPNMVSRERHRSATGTTILIANILPCALLAILPKAFVLTLLLLSLDALRFRRQHLNMTALINGTALLLQVP